MQSVGKRQASKIVVVRCGNLCGISCWVFDYLSCSSSNLAAHFLALEGRGREKEVDLKTALRERKEGGERRDGCGGDGGIIPIVKKWGFAFNVFVLSAQSSARDSALLLLCQKSVSVQ